MKNNIPEVVSQHDPKMFYRNLPELRELIAYLGKWNNYIPSSMIVENTSFQSKSSLREFMSQNGIKYLSVVCYNALDDSYKITEIGKEWVKYC